MLDERTVASTVVSRQEEPVSFSPSQALRRLADFLDGVPGLPDVYITVSDNQRVGLQMTMHGAEPQERSLAVARVAQALGVETRLQPCAGGQFDFEARGTAFGLAMHVYAPYVGSQAESTAPGVEGHA
ncbi:hypothetical protein [Streptomyces cylindrosporus]|uniref:Uncharacterized protein n=1 Tax=Streptomyces cylindrosporus TaxID=2927583 RepID=A0ABS9YG92_9ACTN|nr:hypothetical protein [Streptomyces cylindrosporus]MCI3276246.1 hypothetical protein [Streptomyces cylindrosporus]